MPRASRSFWKASERVGDQLDPGAERARLGGVGVECGVGGEGDAAQRQPGGDHRGEAGEPLGEVRLASGRVGDRTRVRGAVALGVLEWEQRPAHRADLGGGLGDLGDRRVTRVALSIAQLGQQLERPVEALAPQAAHPEVEVVGLVDRRRRCGRGGERRVHRPVHRQPLERVVGRCPRRRGSGRSSRSAATPRSRPPPSSGAR